MKAIQEVLRLHATGLSHRQIAQACRLSKGAVGKYLHLAEQAKVTWPLPTGLDAHGLEALLFPPASQPLPPPMPHQIFP